VDEGAFGVHGQVGHVPLLGLFLGGKMSAEGEVELGLRRVVATD
jgi:hypothetical protein